MRNTDLREVLPPQLNPAANTDRFLDEALPPIIALVFATISSEFERDYLTQLLQITNSTITRAAQIARCNCTEFYKLLHKQHMEPAQFKVTKS